MGLDSAASTDSAQMSFFYTLDDLDTFSDCAGSQIRAQINSSLNHKHTIEKVKSSISSILDDCGISIGQVLSDSGVLLQDSLESLFSK